MEPVIFLPTVMKDFVITFLDDERISARDCYQGYIWSLPDGEQLKHVHFQKTDPKVRFYEPYCQSTPDAEMEYSFIHGAPDQASGLYQVSTASPIYTLDFSPSQVVVSPDGKLVALNSGDKLVVLNYADGTVLQEMAETGVKWLFFYPDSSIVAAVYENQTKFWSTDSFELLDTVIGTGLGSSTYSYPEFSPDGSVLVFRVNEVYRFYRSSDRALINGITGFGIRF
jgi:WD40 repeat protein